MNLSSTDKEALEFARALQRTDWKRDSLRALLPASHYLHISQHPVTYEAVAVAVLGRAAVIAGELAGLVERLAEDQVWHQYEEQTQRSQTVPAGAGYVGRHRSGWVKQDGHIG